jgi:MazG family protein
LSSAEALADLQQLALRLRRDCPWDREQTAQTIVPHTVEEAYEVADAALGEDSTKLVDELGDLLYQVFFLSLLLEERGEGNLEAVARAIHDKLVRRHPHVFGDAEAETADRVRENWEQIKVREDDALFAGIARSLPALVFARKVQQRSAGIGFEYEDAAGALGDLEEEVAELRGAAQGRSFEELGDVLFAAVNTARKLGVDPELALRQATLRFVERVEAAERLAADDGREFAALPLDEQDAYFERAKESL